MPTIDEVPTKAKLNTRSAKNIQVRRNNNFPIRSESHQNIMSNKRQPLPLSEACLAEFDRTSQHKAAVKPSIAGRPMSAATHTTAMASHMSILPQLNTQQVMSVARVVFDARATVIQLTRLPNSKVNLRDTISSTQIYQILKRNGVYVDLGHIKVLLRELSLPFNGPSTSFTMLFQACKAYLHGNGMPSGEKLRSDITNSEFSALHKGKANYGKQTEVQKIIGKIRDLFYATKENLYEIFKVGMTGVGLDYEGFYRVVKQVSSGQVDDEEID